MYCENCGKDLTQQDTVCPNCGAAAIAKNLVEYPRILPKKKTRAQIVWQILAVLVLVLIGAPSCLMGGCFLIITVAGAGASSYKDPSYWLVPVIGLAMVGVFVGAIYFYRWAFYKKDRG